jgi:transcriptional regulator with XRE-family HTH domain
MRPSQLRMARAALKLTVRQLEAQTGVKKNTISRYEAGQEVLASAVRKLEILFQEEGLTFVHESETHGPGVLLPLEPSHPLEYLPKTASKLKHEKPAKK